MIRINCLTASFHLMVWTSSSCVTWPSLPLLLIFFGKSFWYLQQFKVILVPATIQSHFGICCNNSTSFWILQQFILRQFWDISVGKFGLFHINGCREKGGFSFLTDRVFCNCADDLPVIPGRLKGGKTRLTTNQIFFSTKKCGGLQKGESAQPPSSDM